MASQYQGPLSALRASHEHLVELVDAMSDDHVEQPSYCAEWNISQVLSHLGSGAEIFSMMLQAALAGDELPGREAFQPFWDKWNGRTPAEVRSTVLDADEAYLTALEGIDDAIFANFRIALFGRDLDAAELVTMRLGEHVLHTWDIEVTGDQQVGLQAPAVIELIDRTPANTARFASGKRPNFSGHIGVVTNSPERHFGLDLAGEQVTLSSDDTEYDGGLSLPAEALIRLLYGRLDEAHTPSGVTASGPVTLDDLRALFPGF